MIPVLPNDFIQIKGTIYRVLDIEPSPGFAFAIDYQDKNALPVMWSRAQFESEAFRKEVKKIEAPAQGLRPVLSAEADRRVQSTRLHRIKPLLDKHRRELFDAARLKRLAKDRAKALNCSYRTVQSDIRKWMQGGMTEGALLGSYHQCGRIDEDDENALALESKDPAGNQIVLFAPAKQKARGRAPSIRPYEKFAMSRDLRRAIASRAIALFKKDEIVSQRLVADTIIGEMFCARGENGEPVRRADGREGFEILPKGMRPTTHQIRYLIRKLVSAPEAHRARVGVADFKNNHSPAAGSVSDDCVGPADVYEIDASIVDLWLVARRSRKTIIGKATIYLVVDRESNLYVGLHLSLENPSWNEARLAVLSVASDWKALCERLGVKYFPEDWVATGVMPNRFFADRGEGNSLISDVLCNDMQIPISNAPALLSRRKPMVESSFATTQVSLRDHAPGYEPPKNARKRRGKHYDSDACLTLDELFAIYLKIIIAHNRKIRKEYRLDPKYIFDGIQATPINIWNLLIETKTGVRPRHSYDFLKLQLMPRDFATVHQDGIHFKNCKYVFDDPTCARWLAAASFGRSFPVTVIFNPALVDHIIILDPKDRRRQFVGRLSSKFRTFEGYSYAEVEACEKKKRVLDDVADDVNQATRDSLGHGIRSVCQAPAAQVRELTKGLALSARHRNADEERRHEAKLRRQETHKLDAEGLHFSLAAEPSAETVEPMSTEPMTGDLTQSDAQPTNDVTQSTQADQRKPGHYDGCSKADSELLSFVSNLLEQ